MKSLDPRQKFDYMMGRVFATFNVALPMPVEKSPANQNRENPPASGHGESRKDLPPAAARALAEARVRREAYLKAEDALPQEHGGRGGLEPGRYGDWEIKGLTSDF